MGLCISLYDLSKVSEGMIGQDGGAHVSVEFRMIVFRPFKGEVLTGRISSATATGVKVRTDFFDEIFVPAAGLFEGSRLYVFLFFFFFFFSFFFPFTSFKYITYSVVLVLWRANNYWGGGLYCLVMARNRFGYGIMMIRTFIWIRMRLLGLGLRARFSWISCLCRRI